MQRIRLPYLDGLRGAAAIYVVLFHNAEEWRPHTAGLTRLALAPFQFGHFAVVLFIVLSGFCLMLPVLQSPTHTLSKGRTEFFRRRARRILPGYYAALAISLLLPFASKHGIRDLLTGNMHIQQTPFFEHFSFANVLAHVILVYNWHPGWVSSFNWPLWSVATEFQIYILFVLILLPTWKHFGSAGAIGLAWAMGISPLLLSPHWNLQWTFPFLESRPLLFLGTISYSIYLLHVPIMEKLSSVNNITEHLHLPISLRILLWFGFSLTCIVLFASFFYRYVEAPFLKPSPMRMPAN